MAQPTDAHTDRQRGIMTSLQGHRPTNLSLGQTDGNDT